MAKAKPQAKKSPAAKAKGAKPAQRLGLLKSAAKAAASLVKTAKDVAGKAKAKVVEPVEAKKPAAKKGEAPQKEKPTAGKASPAAVAPAAPVSGKKAKGDKSRGTSPSLSSLPAQPARVVQQPRATKLPPQGQPINKRELEQVLTVGMGRGVGGEGSLKGRLVVRDGLPNLFVVGRDKRELQFILQGPDQEVLPAYVDHKVSVSGLIRKTHNYGGTVDVRKYSAKKPEEATVTEVSPLEQKLRYLSPGELAQVCAAGMGAGMKGFGTLRGNLEMTGDDFFLVVSNGGTRQQVSFLITGKATKGLKKHIGQTMQVTGVVDKTAGWGGNIEGEHFEVRPTEFRAVSREMIDIVHVDGGGAEGVAEVKLNHGLTVRLPERPGFTWAIEPTVAKRVGLREANFEYSSSGPASREFFFTPRNPGNFDIEFFLAKAFSPAQVSKTYKLNVTVKP